MRCCCCNRALSDFESTLRSSVTGDFLDVCKKCLKGLDIATTERPDLDKVFVKEFEDEDYEDVINDMSEGLYEED